MTLRKEVRHHVNIVVIEVTTMVWNVRLPKLLSLIFKHAKINLCIYITNTPLKHILVCFVEAFVFFFTDRYTTIYRQTFVSWCQLQDVFVFVDQPGMWSRFVAYDRAHVYCPFFPNTIQNIPETLFGLSRGVFLLVYLEKNFTLSP